MLKKILVGILVFIVLVLVFHSFIIGTVVKPQVEKIASKMLDTDVKISVLSVRLWPGSAAVYGLKIKNPTGFSDEDLLDLGSASTDLDVPGLVKQFGSGASGPKTLVINQVKVKNLKLFVERIALASGPKSNVEKLIDNLNQNAKPSEAAKTETKSETKTPPAEQKPMDIHIELKSFKFIDGKFKVSDKTIGSGFEYVVDKVNVDFRNIYFPAKPASELVETVDVSANLGAQNPGVFSFQGKSNFMAGPNLDAKLAVQDVSLADFNAFLNDQSFQLKAGKFSLQSGIKILNNQLESQHQLDLNSMSLAGKEGEGKLIDLPLQTLLSAVNKLPSISVPFEVSGDLTNPQFKVTKAIRSAITAAIQKVLAGGLGDLKGVAQDLKDQALGVAGESTAKIAGDAKKIVEGITAEGSAGKIAGDAKNMVSGVAGEGTEAISGGLKKLSGLLGKVKSE